MNWLRHVLVVLLGATGLLGTPGLRAETTCNITGSGLSFGSVDSARDTEVTGYIGYRCQTFGNAGGVGLPDQSIPIQMCVGLGAGGSIGSSLADRRMENTYLDQVRFQLYKDPGRVEPWGETVAATPSYLEVAIAIPAGADSVEGTLDVHGLVPVQPDLAAGFYGSSLAGTLRYDYKESGNAKNLDCVANGQGSGVAGFLFNVDATVPGRCTITATNLDFSPGGMPLLSTSTGNLTSTSTIALECSRRTAWQVGLNDGANGLAADRVSRQVCNAAGACIRYQLDRAPVHGGGRWGDTEGSDTVDGSSNGTAQTLIVHGAIADQPLTQAGLYSDTITVTLTY